MTEAVADEPTLTPIFDQLVLDWERYCAQLAIQHGNGAGPVADPLVALPEEI